VCATDTIIFAVAIRASVSKYFCRNHCPVQDSGTKRMELPPRSLRPTCTPRQGRHSLTHSLTQSVTRSCTQLFLDLCVCDRRPPTLTHAAVVIAPRCVLAFSQPSITHSPTPRTQHYILPFPPRRIAEWGTAVATESVWHVIPSDGGPGPRMGAGAAVACGHLVLVGECDMHKHSPAAQRCTLHPSGYQRRCALFVIG
jgi:hypothetical protein